MRYFRVNNTGRKYLVFLDFWYLDTRFCTLLKVYMIEICSELHHELAKEGMEKACDRLQCTKMSTLYLGVVISQYLTSVIFRHTVFFFKAISGIRCKRFYNF